MNLNKACAAKTFSLDRLEIGGSAVIYSIINKNERQIAYLNDIGFVPGETVKPLFVSPLGDPTAYLLGSGVKIALRKLEAEKIIVAGKY